MSTPSTNECVRLEFDDGSGKDFATAADALFELAYGRDGSGLRGVVHVCTVVHTDAEPMVIDNEPVLNHVPPQHGEIVWDRAQLEELVAQAHASDETPPPGGTPDETTVAAVFAIAEEA